MHTWINEYIDIENNPANHRRKGPLLEQLFARIPASEHISFEGVLMLLDQLEQRSARLRMPLFARVVYPVLEREIEADNMQAIKVLLSHVGLMYDYYRMMKCPDKYSAMELINRYLQHNPNDREVLEQKKAALDTILSFSVHELPYGVLYSMDGATVRQCERLLETLHEYEQVCQHLGYDVQEDIDYFAMHFNGYRDYLLHKHLYTDYQEYIRLHQLEI